MKFLRSSGLAVVAALCVSKVEAFTPEIGQVIRFQPNVLRISKSFISKGHAIEGKNRMPLLLEWRAPGNYRVTIENIPKAFYANGEGSGSWVLTRQISKCSLKTDALTTSCPAAAAWAALTLSGQTDEAISALIESGFVNQEDSMYRETDSRTPPKDPKEKRVQPALGLNGKTPWAVLEIRGPDLKSEVVGEEYPVIQYDQSFLTPLMVRFSNDGEVLTIQATSELHMAERKTRYSHVLPTRIELSAGKSLRAAFTQADPVPAHKPLSLQTSRTITDISSLNKMLSVEGRNFLRSLLLTY